jgi:hypothetical protein
VDEMITENLKNSYFGTKRLLSEFKSWTVGFWYLIPPVLPKYIIVKCVMELTRTAS